MQISIYYSIQNVHNFEDYLINSKVKKTQTIQKTYNYKSRLWSYIENFKISLKDLKNRS